MNWQVMFQLQGMLFALTLAGVYARKRNIITAEARSYLSDLLIEIILPLNIISAFHVQLDEAVLRQAGVTLLLATIIQIFCYFIGMLLYRKKPADLQAVLRYSTIVTNAAFMGLPIVRSVLGTEAALYASVALIPLRVFMWSAGLSLFTPVHASSTLKRLITHPCNIAVAAGFLVLLIPIHLPSFLWQSISTIGDCATAVSMLIVGGFLAEIDFKTVLSRDAVLFSFMRLLVIPLAVYGLTVWLKVDGLIAGALILLSAMPAGITTAILPAKYGGNAVFATKIIFVSTILSLLTLPLMSLLATQLG